MKRLCFHLDDKLHSRSREVIPWGDRDAIYRNLTLRAIEAIEVLGDTAVGALYSGEFEIQFLSPTSVPEEE